MVSAVESSNLPLVAAGPLISNSLADTSYSVYAPEDDPKNLTSCPALSTPTSKAPVIEVLPFVSISTRVALPVSYTHLTLPTILRV